MAKNIIMGFIIMLLMVSLGFNYYQYQQLQPYKAVISENAQNFNGQVVSNEKNILKVNSPEKEIDFVLDSKTQYFKDSPNPDGLNSVDMKANELIKDMNVGVVYITEGNKNIARRVDYYQNNILNGKIKSINQDGVEIEVPTVQNIKLTDKTTYYKQVFTKDESAGLISNYKSGELKSVNKTELQKDNTVNVYLNGSVDDSIKTATSIVIVEYK